MVEDHRKYCIENILTTGDRCDEESIGAIMVEILVSNLENGTLAIRGLTEYDHEHAKKIVGVVRPDDNTPGIAYLYPPVLTEFVLQFGKHRGLVGSQTAFGESLKSMGLLAKTNKGTSYYMTRVDKTSPTRRYFAIDLKKIGLITGKPLEVKTETRSLPIDPPPTVDQEGLF